MALTERWVLDHLPAAVLVIDETGVIVAASTRAAALVGRTLPEFVGTSILTYVPPDAVWAYAAALNTAIDATFIDTYGGPVRIAIQGPDGHHVAADLWSSNEIDSGGPRAVVLLLTEQTVALGVAEAVGLAATGANYADVAAAAAGALGGFPVIADAAVFDFAGGECRWVAGNVPRSLVDGTAGPGPWNQLAEHRERMLFSSPADLGGTLGELTAAAGYVSVWVEPVRFAEGPLLGAIAAFRRLPGEPTSNELANLHQAAAALAMARSVLGAA